MNASTLIDTAALLSITPYKSADALAADDPKLAPFLTYETRDSYLAWVAAWKAEYRALSAAIRAEKLEWRAAGSDIPWQLAVSLRDHKRLARSLLALRHAGKIDSWARAQAIRTSLAQASTTKEVAISA